MKTLGVSYETAEEMSFQTMGYPFAYQAFGKYMWDSEKKEITEEILEKVNSMIK